MAFETRAVAAVTVIGLLAGCNNTLQIRPFLSSVNGAAYPAGPVGSTVIVRGISFGNTQGAGQVAFTNPLGGLTVHAVIAAPGDWTNTSIVTTVPDGASSGAVVVLAGGLTSDAILFTVDSAITFDPAAVSWTGSSTLSTAVSGNAAASAQLISGATVTPVVYNVGGADGSGDPTTTVSYATVGTDGSLSAWQAASAQLSTPVAFHAAVVATPRNSAVTGPGYLYVLGGVNAAGGAPVTTILRGTLNASGDVTSWTSGGALPVAVRSLGAVVAYGSLYVVGGATMTGLSATVYRAPIQTNGSLGTWTALASLPFGRARFGIGLSGLYLYVFGGDSAFVSPDDTTLGSAFSSIVSAKINASNGNLATGWQDAGSLASARTALTAVIGAGNVLVTGGAYSGATTGTDEESYAALNGDGTVGSFSTATGAIGTNLFNQAATAYSDSSASRGFHVLVVGGDDVGNPGVKTAESHIY
jgi:hypothetical protein